MRIYEDMKLRKNISLHRQTQKFSDQNVDLFLGFLFSLLPFTLLIFIGLDGFLK